MATKDNFIEELKLKNDIVEVVSSYATLTRSGNNYWARCPFPGHNERTASFSVNETGQFCHCFGCKRGGDVITFVKEVENIDFMEAVTILAKRVGLEVPNDRENYSKKDDGFNREKMQKLLKDTALFYVHNLKNAPKHLEYLQKRNINKDCLKDFGIGASLDYDSLPKYLLEKGYTQEEMLSIGVVQKSEKGRLYDFQAERLIIPIIDNYNNVIAFGGRFLGKTDRAKYKNTKETRLFVKNKVLYNVNNLKKYKKEVGEIDNVIVVEGYMDTISLYKAGFKNVVASMGTALTIQQAKLLKRYTNKVTICYDGDFAGQTGALRGLEILKNEDLEVKIASIPDNLDPDDIINKYGAEKFEEIIKNAMSLIEYKLHLIEEKFGEKSKNPDKLKLISNSLKVIREVPSVAEQENLLMALRDKTGITYESLKRDLEREGKTEIKAKEEVVPARPKDVSDKIRQAQRFVLLCVMLKKEYAKDVDLNEFVFENPTLAKLAELIVYNDIKPNQLGGEFSSEELAEIDLVLNSWENILDTNIEKKYFLDCLRQLQIDELEKQLDALIKECDKEEVIDIKMNLVKLIQEKTIKLTRLKNGG